MVTKKRLGMLVALMALATLLTACGGGVVPDGDHGFVAGEHAALGVAGH